MSNKMQQEQINQTAFLASVVGQVGCMTVFIIAGALGAGLMLDKFLETKAIFTILFLVGSVPITLYIIVRVSLTALAKTTQKNLESEKNTEGNTEL